MAGLGHVAVGMVAARGRRHDRPAWQTMAAWSALSLLPDADVVGLGLGIAYGDPFGHRGASHSFVFALAVGAVVGLVAHWRGHRGLGTGALATAVLASHGLLDTLTDGGLGSALFWPFDVTRYFAPWRPIPVSPIGLGLLSPYGFVVAATEIVLFAPLFVFAWRPRRVPKILLPLWVVAAWLLVSGDWVRDAVVGVLFRENTEYATGFSSAGFDAIRPGQSSSEVRQLVGAPMGQWWDYDVRGEQGCPFVYLEADAVSGRDLLEACARRGVRPGMPSVEAARLLGPSSGVCWRYSKSGGGRAHRARVICFRDDKVVEVVRGWLPG